MSSRRTLLFSGGAIVLGLIAVIVFLQTREGSDLPEGRGPADESAILGAAIQLHVPSTPAPPSSPADGGTTPADDEQVSSEPPTPPDPVAGDEGAPAEEPGPADSPGLREDRPSGGGDDPMDLIDDITDELPVGGR